MSTPIIATPAQRAAIVDLADLGCSQATICRRTGVPQHVVSDILRARVTLPSHSLLGPHRSGTGTPGPGPQAEPWEVLTAAQRAEVDAWRREWKEGAGGRSLAAAGGEEDDDD